MGSAFSEEWMGWWVRLMSSKHCAGVNESTWHWQETNRLNEEGLI